MQTAQALPCIISPKPRRFVMPERCRAILNEVARERNLDPASIMERSRRHPVVHARHEIFYRIRSELGWSYPRIGRVFGYDHSTILWGAGCHAMRLAKVGKCTIKRANGGGRPTAGVLVMGKIIDRSVSLRAA